MKISINKKITGLLWLMMLVAISNIIIIYYYEKLERDVSVQVSVASSQQALSQEMTKLAFSIGTGNEDARYPLTQRIKLYDSSLKALQYGGSIKKKKIPPAPATSAFRLNKLFDDNKKIWKKFKSKAYIVAGEKRDNPIFTVAITYIKDHNEKFLQLNDQVVSAYDSLPNASEYAHEISVAGRQQVLSQMMTKYAFSLASGKKSKEKKRKLEEAVRLYENSLKALINGGKSEPWGKKVKPAPASVKSIEENVFNNWIKFKRKLGIIKNKSPANMRFQRAIEYIEKHNDELVEVNNDITESFTRFFNKQVEDIDFALTTLLLIDLFILLIGSAVVKKITQPIRDLSVIVRKFGKGEFGQNVPIPKAKDEIRELSLAFDKMIKQLRGTTVSKDYLDNILDSMIDALLVINTRGRITRVNKASCKLLRYKKKELLGQKIEKIAPEMFEGYKLKKILKKETLNFQETTYHTKKGKRIPVHFSGAVMKNKQKRPVGIVTIADDITDRRRSERILKESEEKYRKLIETANDAIFVTEAETGKIIDVNQKAEDLLGIPAGEIIGNPQAPFFRKEDGELYKIPFLEAAKKAIKEKDQQSKEAFIAHKSGYLIPVEISSSVTNIMGKKIIYSVLRNITDRKRAENALRESEMKWRSLTENSPDYIMTLDREGIIQFVNRTEAGLLKEDAIGTSAFIYIPKEYRPVMKVSFHQVMETGKPGKFEYRLYKSAGISQVFESHVGPVIRSGKVIGLTVSTSNITERKLAEEELRESRQRLQGILDNTSAVIYLKDTKGRYLLINRQFEALFHITREAITGKTDHDIFPGKMADDFIQNDHKVISTRTLMEIEEQAPHDDGVHTYISIKFPLFDSQGALYAVCGVSTDITDRKLAEENLKNSREELQNLSRHLQTLIENERASIAREIHDELGQTLTAIQMDLSGITLELPRHQRKLARKLESINTLVESSINNIQKLSFNLRPSILDNLGVVPAIKQHVKEFESRTKIKCKISFSSENIDLDKDYSITVFRVFQEALTNITRHAKATAVKADLTKKDGRITLSIKDNGIGITEEQISSPKSIGIIGMRERVRLVGGDVKIDGLEGTSLTINIPIIKKGAYDKSTDC